MKRKLKQEFNSLEHIKEFLETKTDLECSVTMDKWVTMDKRTISAKDNCVLVKKSGSAGAKVVLLDDNIINIQAVAPSTFIHNSTLKGFVAIIVRALISGSQNEVATEVENHLLEISLN